VKTPEQNKAYIMRRIYLLWFLRQVFNPLSIKAVLIVLLGWQMTSYVSIKHVIANWNLDGGLTGSFSFLESAVLNTEIMTQILVLGMVAFTALLVRDIIQRRKITTEAFMPV
jgi:hypothetical protein